MDLTPRPQAALAALCGGAAVAALALGGAAGAAGAGAVGPGGAPIRPNQVFGALVNGSDGSAGPVVVHMGCGGAAAPGSTGHPLKGQTVTVFEPEVILGRFGNTGPYGTAIGAYFGPAPAAAAGSHGAVVFHHYVTRGIPTSEVLPCLGTGAVTFVPLPLSGKDVVVPVRYVPQVAA